MNEGGMVKKIISFSIALVILITACNQAAVPDPTATPAPSPTPTTMMGKPTLLREIQLETQTGTSYSLDWSRDGTTLAAGSGYELTLLNQDLTGTPVVLRPESGALVVSWSPDGKQIATVFGYRNPEITISSLDPATNQLTEIRQLDGSTDQYSVAWSPDGKLLATLADDDRTVIQIWDSGTWERIHIYELPYGYPRRALNWSRDSTTLYDAGEIDGRVVAFALQVADGSVQEMGRFPVEKVYAFAASPDGRMVALADEDGTVELVDVASGEVYSEIKTVDQPVDLAWHPGGKLLAILGYETALQLWKIGE
jgi:WD40 repeat protein